MLGVLMFVILFPDAILALPRLLMPRFAGWRPPRKRLKHFSPRGDIVLKHDGRILATSARGDPPRARRTARSEEGTGP